ALKRRASVDLPLVPAFGGRSAQVQYAAIVSTDPLRVVAAVDGQIVRVDAPIHARGWRDQWPLNLILGRSPGDPHVTVLQPTSSSHEPGFVTGTADGSRIVSIRDNTMFVWEGGAVNAAPSSVCPIQSSSTVVSAAAIGRTGPVAIGLRRAPP